MLGTQELVQYSVGVPADYLFQVENPAQVVGAAVEAAMARRVARSSVDAILTTEKAAIQDEVRAAAQALSNQYRAGPYKLRAWIIEVLYFIGKPPGEQ